jgi:hypothetical protein
MRSSPAATYLNHVGAAHREKEMSCQGMTALITAPPKSFTGIGQEKCLDKDRFFWKPEFIRAGDVEAS